MSSHTSDARVQKHRQERSRAMARAVVAAITERLTEEAAKQGGVLSQRHIDDLSKDFQAKADQLASVFEQALNEAVREQEELKWHAIKRPAFDRLMVKRFEHLFVQRGDNGIPHGIISRRLLPGFFLALNMMLGPQALEHYRRHSDGAVQRIMKGREPIGWDLVDQDGEILDIVLDAQLAVALHFEDTPRRIDWFVNIANSHLAPVTDDHAPDAQWELSARALQVLINSLLSDLKKAVNDDRAWDHLAQRHPEADRIKMSLILDRLD